MTTRYDSDFYGWTQEQAGLLRDGNLHQLDLVNLLEEVEAMGRSERREFESRLEILLAHLLKWQYQPERQSRSWASTINLQRKRVNRCLKDSPSLKHRLEESFADAYECAVSYAAKETGMSESSFPSLCPWTFEQAMVSEFFPE